MSTITSERLTTPCPTRVTRDLGPRSVRTTGRRVCRRTIAIQMIRQGKMSTPLNPYFMLSVSIGLGYTFRNTSSQTVYSRVIQLRLLIRTRIFTFNCINDKQYGVRSSWIDTIIKMTPNSFFVPGIYSVVGVFCSCLGLVTFDPGPGQRKTSPGTVILSSRRNKSRMN